MSDVVRIAFSTAALANAGSDLRDPWDAIGVSRPDRTETGLPGYQVGQWEIDEEEKAEVIAALQAAGVKCYTLDDLVPQWKIQNDWELYTVS